VAASDDEARARASVRACVQDDKEEEEEEEEEASLT